MASRNPEIPTLQRARPPRHDAGSTLIGVFIGVVIGLAIAAAVAFYVMRSQTAYQASARDTRDTPGTRSTKGDTSPKGNRFEFYKILPGGEDPKVARAPDRSADRETVERTFTPESAPDAKPEKAEKVEKVEKAGERPVDRSERFWLQAGSFSTADDAESLKAKLALAGWEANVQEASVPDKGVRYRVRLGPYDNTDELNRIKGELGRRGFDVAVIKY